LIRASLDPGLFAVLGVVNANAKYDDVLRFDGMCGPKKCDSIGQERHPIPLGVTEYEFTYRSKQVRMG
jgi:hypothetical protein